MLLLLFRGPRLAVFLFWCALFTPLTYAQLVTTSDQDTVLQRLQDRVHARPDDGASWRLLGRVLFNQSRFTDAEAALQKAVALRPQSAAAWFDLGRTKLAMRESSQAKSAFQTVLDLAPESEYAASAETELQQLESENGEVVQAGYEIRSFTGEEFLNRLEDTDPPQRSWLAEDAEIRVETGLLYNSNVTLAPLSRQLSPRDRESVQLFVAPDLQFTVRDQQTWRTGPTLRGYFTLNQGDFEDLNLQSYRPGWFGEWFLFQEDRIFVPRLAYELTHDEFDGSTLGNRHSLLTSLSSFWNDQHATFLFYSVDRTDFTQDGVLPEVTSQDGWTNTLGLSHDVALPYRWLSLVRAGTDVTRTKARGTDYSFHGVNLFTEGVVPLADTVELTVRGGWGYRDYFDFEFSPSRNEHLWHAGLEARKYFSSQLSAAFVFDYNKFDSQNPLFAAERYLSGMVLEMEF